MASLLSATDRIFLRQVLILDPLSTGFGKKYLVKVTKNKYTKMNVFKFLSGWNGSEQEDTEDGPRFGWAAISKRLDIFAFTYDNFEEYIGINI